MLTCTLYAVYCMQNQPSTVYLSSLQARKRALVIAEAVQRLLEMRDELAGAGSPLGAGQTPKAWAVQHILQSCTKRGEKLVIFCQYLTDLDEIEVALKKVSATSLAVIQIGRQLRLGYCTVVKCSEYNLIIVPRLGD